MHDPLAILSLILAVMKQDALHLSALCASICRTLQTWFCIQCISLGLCVLKATGPVLQRQETYRPVIQWAAPKLTSLAESIRGHPRHIGWGARWGQLKKLLVGPHICRLPSNIDGHVAYNLDLLAVCICLHACKAWPVIQTEVLLHLRLIMPACYS